MSLQICFQILFLGVSFLVVCFCYHCRKSFFLNVYHLWICLSICRLYLPSACYLSVFYHLPYLSTVYIYKLSSISLLFTNLPIIYQSTITYSIIYHLSSIYKLSSVYLSIIYIESFNQSSTIILSVYLSTCSSSTTVSNICFVVLVSCLLS